MIYRFKPLQSSVPADPCDQSATLFDYEGVSLDLLIEVDGTEIYSGEYNDAMLASVLTGTGLAVELSVEDGVETGVVVKLEIPLVNINDTASVRIKLSNEDYKTFDTTFTVFGYDLGNNEDVAVNITTNPDMDIMLLPLTTTDYTYAKMVAYRKPDTSRIYYYNLTNSRGTSLFQDYSNNFLSYGNSMVDNCETLRIVQLANLYETANGAYSPSCPTEPIYYCSANQVVDALVVKPTLVPVVSTVNPNCEDCACSAVDDSNVTLPFDVDQLALFYKDDVQVPPYSIIEVTYTLKTLDGTEIGTALRNLDLDDIITNGFNINDTLWNLPTMDYDKIYILEMVAIVSPTANTIWFTCTTETTIVPCSYTELKETACGEYTIENYEEETMSVVVNKLIKIVAEVPEVTEIETFTVLASATHDFTLTDPGVYLIEITKGEVSYTRVVFNLCEIKQCFLTNMQNILCNSLDDCGCNKTKIGNAQYNQQAFITQYFLLLAYMNNVYITNWIFETIDTTMFTNLFNISKIIDNLTKYCETCE
jgi:hypothetical protein